MITPGKLRLGNARQVVGDCVILIEPPRDAVRFRKTIGDEADVDDACKAKGARIDLDQRDGQDISGLGPLDVDRPRQRVNRAPLRAFLARIVILARRIEVEVGRVAGVEDDRLAGPRARGHRNVGMQTIDALRIFDAIAPLAADVHDVVLRGGARRP